MIVKDEGPYVCLGLSILAKAKQDYWFGNKTTRGKIDIFLESEHFNKLCTNLRLNPDMVRKSIKTREYGDITFMKRKNVPASVFVAGLSTRVREFKGRR